MIYAFALCSKLARKAARLPQARQKFHLFTDLQSLKEFQEQRWHPRCALEHAVTKRREHLAFVPLRSGCRYPAALDTPKVRPQAIV
jgi:hypothetical protein